MSFFLLLFSACGSTYHHNANNVYKAYYDARFDEAADLIEKVKPAEKDRLLYLMDKGMILHAAGRYEESNKTLSEAEELSDVYSVKSASREVSGTLWNEETIEYAGDKHERLMIPTLRILNYIMLDKWDDALVEVRRLLNLTEKIYGNQNNLENGFAVYLSAIVWETLNQINDALISYGQLNSKNKELPYYGYDLKLMRSKLGLKGALPPKSSLAWTESKDYRKHAGQLLVIVETGKPPVFVSKEVVSGAYTIHVPVAYVYPQNFVTANIYVDGENKGKVYPFYNIANDIVIAEKERQKRSMIRKMVKVPVQTGLYVTSEELMRQKNKDGSADVASQAAGVFAALLGLSMAAAEKADERSWRSLPATFHLGRFYLEPGSHEIEIVPQGAGASVKRTVNVEKGGPPTVLLLNIPDAVTTIKKANTTAVKNADASKTARKETDPHEMELMEEIAKHPRNGNLRIDYAYLKMKQGDYKREYALTSGMREGGDKGRAIKALIISNTVLSKYGKAMEWIDQAETTSLKDELPLAEYRSAISYLTGGVAQKPSVTILQNQDNLIEALNYYLLGLVEEKSGDMEIASYNYMMAYKKGLVGYIVENKLISTFEKTSDAFKNTKEGKDVAEEFSEIYLKTHKEVK
ncbi:MAG: hypothetical protein COS89_00150 [Deltaproteobacteria bacterium CG07_land_8_20_14_0_80_38_7]|nr:MAG: hypothetical protein COS89_00150 [Deltaproteobacteria bacterium CG07_land_8_20_14_0_80_38_7]